MFGTNEYHKAAQNLPGSIPAGGWLVNYSHLLAVGARLVAGGGGLGGQFPPPTRNKIEIMPHPKFALANFNHFLPELQMTQIGKFVKCAGEIDKI